ncbi:MAG: hypothetical protein RLZZ628_1491 [Bacteroidota bacterium]|jgi:DNA polymerase III sliding clamp (beta) subunit (PCNA family)
MIHFNFIAKDCTSKIYERYAAQAELPERIHKVCRTIQRKQFATFSIIMEGLPNVYFNIDQDFLSISTEITAFLRFLRDPSPSIFKLHFHERNMSFEFYGIDELEVQFKCIQKENIILESTVPRSILLENIETMLKDFSDLIKHQFPRAYKIFKAEDFVL